NQHLDTLYQNAIILDTEIVEIKPRININNGQQYLQATRDIGNLDTNVDDIKPSYHNVEVLGRMSDPLMTELLNNDLYPLSDKIQFSLGYKALAKSMFM